MMNLVFFNVVSLLDKGHSKNTCKLVGRGGLANSLKLLTQDSLGFSEDKCTNPNQFCT